MKPFAPVTVTVEVPVEPAVIVTLLGLVAIVKSVIWKEMVVECVSEPLVPVTVAV